MEAIGADDEKAPVKQASFKHHYLPEFYTKRWERGVKKNLHTSVATAFFLFICLATRTAARRGLLRLCEAGSRGVSRRIMEIENQFTKAMFDIYWRAKIEARYNATVFLKMLSDRGGLSTATYLINSDKPSDGYTSLYERGRLDLTVEAMVIENPRWHTFFTEHKLVRARKRLDEYRRQPLQ